MTDRASAPRLGPATAAGGTCGRAGIALDRPPTPSGHETADQEPT